LVQVADRDRDRIDPLDRLGADRARERGERQQQRDLEQTHRHHLASLAR
jgi:hypothetical protein